MNRRADDEIHPCALCDEPILPNDDWQKVNGRLRAAHRECLLRSVMGGIGHLEDHPFWCLVKHDPDGGRSYRQSARECDDWVVRHGIRAARPGRAS